MNSTTRSLLFWMVLVVVGAVIWNLSNQFRTGDNEVAFSEFMRWVHTGQVNSVELSGNEIVGTSISGDLFRTYAPPQYEGLANELIDLDVQVEARAAVASPWATLLYSWAPILLISDFGCSSCGRSRAAGTRPCRSARAGPSCQRAHKRR